MSTRWTPGQPPPRDRPMGPPASTSSTTTTGLWLRPALLGLFVASLLFSIPGAFVYPAATFYLNPTRAWELLLAMLVMEAAFGLPGLVAAPVFYAYVKRELVDQRWI